MEWLVISFLVILGWSLLGAVYYCAGITPPQPILWFLVFPFWIWRKIKRKIYEKKTQVIL